MLSNAEAQPDVCWEQLRAAGVWFLALLVGTTLGVSAAFANDADVAAVDAAWGYIRRNFYDQTFNNQDWEAARPRYLARAQRGESAAALTREMVASLRDRYSRVVDASTFEQLMAYDPLGVGLVLSRNDKKEACVSSPPFKGSIAAVAGIQQGDVVVAIDGAYLEKESLFSVMDRVTQADAAQVKLSLRRGAAETATTWEQTLTRKRTSEQKDKVEAGVAAVGQDGHRVGYLRLRNFGARGALDMNEALVRVRAEGADELVLDLRGNPGGSFQVALEIAALFLEPGSVAARVQTPGSGGEHPVRVGTPGVPVAREPLAVLVDQGSASSSEVLAAALRGNCRAPLLGARTYGKAAVQGVFGLPNREAVALTVAKYSGPSGTAIGEGLEPDGAGPEEGPLSRAASALGLPVDLSPADYAGIDFGAREEQLRGCQPPVVS